MKVIETIVGALLGALLLACLIAPAIDQRASGDAPSDDVANARQVVVEETHRRPAQLAEERARGGHRVGQ